MPLRDHVVRVQLHGEWQGQGVAVPGGYVLTAAHCLPAPKGVAFIWHDTIVRVRRPDGVEGRVQVCFLDAVSDVAAMCEADCDPFFIDDVEPIPVSLAWSEPDVYSQRPASPGRIFTHDAGDVGIAWRELYGGSGVYKPERHIFGGTSGGPIVDAAGRLIGVVSNALGSNVADDERDPLNVGDEEGSFRLLGAALPPWIARQILAAQADG
jgi:hypothetical protein